jgi:hypothetical protein
LGADTDVSEELATSIFRVEVCKFRNNLFLNGHTLCDEIKIFNVISRSQCSYKYFLELKQINSLFNTA